MKPGTYYALKLIASGEILCLGVKSNDGADFCGENTYTLDRFSGEPWIVPEAETAAYVRQYGKTPWYNTSAECPSHRFKEGELQIVEVIVTEKAVEKTVPTAKEFYLDRIKRHRTAGHETDASMLELSIDDFEKVGYPAPSIHDIRSAKFLI